MSERDGGSGRTSADGSGRVLIWGAAALVFAAGLALFALLPKSAPPRTANETSSKAPAPDRESAPVVSPQPSVIALPARAPTARAAPAASAKPPLEPVDFFAPDAPEALRKMHDVTSSGGILAMPRMKELYQLGKDQPGDARPHLLMAEDAVNRGWDAFAVSHYERAFREDPRARQDPRMLKDLVAIAGGKSDAAKAVKALTDIYGAAAVPAIEDAIAAAGDKGETDRVGRLSALSQSLAEKAP
jgi:hypothetical protein